jgi:hypothetical protein
MKKEVIFFLSVFVFIVLAGVVYAVPAYNDLHLNIQTTYSNGSVQPGTFNFVFNISNSADCLGVVYSKSVTLTTDARGIISYYLTNVTSLDFYQQYWLCYYRDGILSDTVELAKTPSSFSATNATLSGIGIDTNLNLAGFNLSNANYATANYFVGNGSLLTGITGGNSSWNQSSLLGNFIFNTTTNNFEIRNQSATNLFFVNESSGAVSLGSNNSFGKLYVSGGSIILDNNFGYAQRTSGGVLLNILSLNNNNNVVIGSASAGALYTLNKFLVGNTSFAPIATLGVAGNLAVGANYSSLAAPTNGSIFEGKVGISTSSPQNTLNVVGDINATQALYTNGLNVTAYLTNGTFSTSGDNTSWNQSSIIGGMLINLTNQNFEIRNSTTSNLFYVNGTSGFVGFNLSNPTTVLDIGGNLSLEANSTIGIKRNDGLIAGTIRLSGDGVGLLIKQGGGSSYINLATNSNPNAIRIIDSGAVGINTTSPQNTLNVVGDINTTTNLYTNGLNITNLTGYFTNGTFYPYSNPYSYYNSSTLPSSTANGTNPYFNNLNTTGLLNISNFAFGNSTNFWINLTTNPANTPLSSFFTIGKGKGINEYNLSGIEFGNSTSGFLGVNTSSPQNTLNVIGSVNFTGIGNSTNSFDVYGNISGNKLLEVGAVNTTGTIGGISANLTYATIGNALNWTINTGNISCNSGSNNSIQENATGWYGCNGNSVITLFGASVTGDNTSWNQSIVGNLAINLSAGNFTLSNATGSKLFVVNGTNGFVGIGTSNPTSLLHVSGNANISGTLYSTLINISNGGNLNFSIVNQTSTLLNMTNGSIGMGTSDIAPTGFTQISPRARFEVWQLVPNGTAITGQGYIGLLGVGNSLAVPSYGVKATGATGGYDFYGTGPTSYFAGNVGINTTSPNSSFNVVGTFNSTNNGGSLSIDSSGNILVGI